MILFPTTNWLTIYYQCAIPAFDGLLPEPHNSSILKLLFTCVHWHGLAKLRMHTDPTLEILDNTTILLGAQFRAFAEKTCSGFDTVELKREKEARQRRQMKRSEKQKAKNASNREAQNILATDLAAGSSSKETKWGRHKKKFNLKSYKYHSLGDYTDMIRRYGTSDSFSTEPVGSG